MGILKQLRIRSSTESNVRWGSDQHSLHGDEHPYREGVPKDCKKWRPWKCSEVFHPCLEWTWSSFVFPAFDTKGIAIVLSVWVCDSEVLRPCLFWFSIPCSEVFHPCLEWTWSSFVPPGLREWSLVYFWVSVSVDMGCLVGDLSSEKALYSAHGAHIGRCFVRAPRRWIRSGPIQFRPGEYY